jgi:N-acetyl-anhydromuramyl-L-alanine amidase AmpD
MDWFVSEHFTAGPDQKIIGYDWFQNETGLVAFQVAVETAKPEPEPEPSGEIPEPDIDYIVDDLMTHPTKVYDTRARTAIKGIVIHHTATDPSVGPHRCAEWHVEKNDWAGIGYHFVVDPDGVIYQTNRLETVSAQAASVNGSTIGVCFQGNFQEVVPTEAQIQAGAHLIAYLQQGLFIETENVKGHREHMATACPGNQWLSGKKWKNLLMAEIARVKEEYIQ